MEIDLHGGSEARQRRRVLLGQCGLDPVERGPEVELVGRRGCAGEGAPGGEQIAADVEEVVEGEGARDHRGRVGPEVAQRHLELLVSQAFQGGEGLEADRLVVGQYLGRRPGPPLLDEDLLGPLGRQLPHLRQRRGVDHGPVEGTEVRHHTLARTSPGNRSRTPTRPHRGRRRSSGGPRGRPPAPRLPSGS